MNTEQIRSVAQGEQVGKTVVVLGMAKSGTSVTSGMLAILGVNMGDALKGPSHSNPKGYFEDEEFIDLHYRIFESARPGSSYWNPPTHREIIAQGEHYAPEIRALIARKQSENVLWGWKLPWTNLTIDLFLPHLRNPHVVVVFRNPLGNARSFERHNRNLNRIDTLDLINFYNELILSFLRKHPDVPRAYVAFEEIVGEPIAVARDLAAFLDLELTDSQRDQIRQLVIPREEIEKEKFRRRGLTGLMRHLGGRIKRRLLSARDR